MDSEVGFVNGCIVIFVRDMFRDFFLERNEVVNAFSMSLDYSDEDVFEIEDFELECYNFLCGCLVIFYLSNYRV